VPSALGSLINIPGVDINWGGILPGGEPFTVPEAPAGFVYGWTANGTPFYTNPMTGHIGCYTKRGMFRYWKPYHPIVFGKRTDGAKLARVAKRHRRVYKELHKLFGKHEVHHHKR